MKKTFLCMMAVIPALVMSCAHKELSYGDENTVSLRVVFDWRNAPSAEPASMTLFLYPDGGGQPLRYDFSGRDGGTVRVPYGKYSAIGMNGDSKNVTAGTKDSFEETELVSRRVPLLAGMSLFSEGAASAPRAEGTADEEVAAAPDSLWTCSLRSIVLDGSVPEHSIVMYPDFSLCSYSLEIRNAENTKYVYDVSGAISGMSGGLYPSDGRISETVVTVPFAASSFPEDRLITAEWFTFGECPSGAGSHKLTVYAVLADGSKWFYTYDVTSQVHLAADRRRVHIVIDGLPLPKPIVNGGGFHPEVGEWSQIDVDIEM